MTSDRAAKKATRARMAATGEHYTPARRALRGNPPPEEPEEIENPPAIDPRQHAIHSRQWGAAACYLVRHQGRYYTWLTHPGHDAYVCAMRDEETGRRFADDWQASNLLHTPWPERIATLYLGDPADGTRILYEAAVLDIEDSGIWFACYDDTDGGRAYSLGPFGDLGEALNEFARRAERAADQLEQGYADGSRGVVSAVLRYRAATARTQAAAATLGDGIRREQAHIGTLFPAVHEAGITRESLSRVLASQELAWPQRPAVRPPGSRLPETAVRTLATHTVDGQHFSLVSYQDSSGRPCVAIERDGDPAASLCEVEVTGEQLVSAGVTMASRGHGIAAVYGRAHDSVTAIHAVTTDGQRVDWPLYDDPDSQQRYFMVIADSGSLADIVASAPGQQVSLQRFFGIWFGGPGREAATSGSAPPRPYLGQGHCLP
jgi:hypothetical protein